MPAPGALSPRNANYQIDAQLNAAEHTITGTEIIRWRNIGRGSTDTLRLHLYWNAWRNTQSSWLREEALAGLDEDFFERPRDDWSYSDISTLSLISSAGDHDLLPSLTYLQPDDGNAEDRTLAAVALPRPVAPGDEITVRVTWTAKVPRTFSRTGVIGNFFFIAHWFPKIAVFEGDAWTAHQFHANTEFFSDYGSYDVRLTLPRGWVLGATGREQSRTDNDNGTTTHHYQQDDVHDFAWTTSPDYLEYRQRFEHGTMPAVEMRLLLQPEHRGQEDRHFAATAAALRYYGEWYGAYPYGHLTVIDPAHHSEAGGMEYPTLFTAGTRWLAPRQSNAPEGVTVHEAGHQFWYGMVGNNETEDGWLDEGLNTFSEERVQAMVFQPNYRLERFFGGFLPWQFRDIPLDRATDGGGLNGYRPAAESDAPAKPTFRYWPGSHAQITYSKTALWLHTLERHLGWDRLQPAMATFFARWRFRHPRPADFFATISEVTGEDLSSFFDNVYRSSNSFDYGVARLDSTRVALRGYPNAPGAPVFQTGDGSPLTRTTVVVRRYGEATFPVDLLVTFDSGEQLREQWDGRDRWQAFVYDRADRALSAQVDPERVLLLDLNYTNNSITLAPAAAPAATKWSMTWLVWLQDLMMTWAFFV